MKQLTGNEAPFSFFFFWPGCVQSEYTFGHNNTGIFELQSSSNLPQGLAVAEGFVGLHQPSLGVLVSLLGEKKFKFRSNPNCFYMLIEISGHLWLNGQSIILSSIYMWSHDHNSVTWVQVMKISSLPQWRFSLSGLSFISFLNKIYVNIKPLTNCITKSCCKT